MPPVTSKVPGNGTNSLSYTIPGAGLDVETVRVVVDASAAAGDVTAEVKITDQSGVVIASKPQADVITQGVTGSATWALRLEDGGAGSGLAYTTIQDEGTALTKRRILDFVGSAVTAVDDPANSRTKVTIGPSVTGDIGCRVFNSGNITVTSGNRPALTFDSEVYDTDGMHSTTVNPERITCVTAGKYLIGGCVAWAANATGNRDADIFLNSLGAFVGVTQGAPNPSAFATTLIVTAVIDFTVGDWVELRGRQDSGGNLDVLAINNYSPYFFAQRLAG